MHPCMLVQLTVASGLARALIKRFVDVLLCATQMRHKQAGAQVNELTEMRCRCKAATQHTRGSGSAQWVF